MFEDIIQEQPEEKSVLPKCNHVFGQDKCQHYIPSTDKTLKPDYKLCEHFGWLSQYCFLDI